MASSTTSSASDTETKPFSVLFVCLGNICRSPAAEGVFRDLVKRRALDSKFKIDSAGTINYHEGNEADPRMRAASKRRGIEITSISRPIQPSDFKDFDLILAMDKQNREDILEAFNRWKFRDPLPADAHKKVKLMCSYCKKHDETEVPDPYYGGPQGFEKESINIYKNNKRSKLVILQKIRVAPIGHLSSDIRLSATWTAFKAISGLFILMHATLIRLQEQASHERTVMPSKTVPTNKALIVNTRQEEESRDQRNKFLTGKGEEKSLIKRAAQKLRRPWSEFELDGLQRMKTASGLSIREKTKEEYKDFNLVPGNLRIAKHISRQRIEERDQLEKSYL
ncbi:putative low molecular weight protein-tyrosine-phosphatase [Senna tora]|uniref:acid phosphatase n=1 Tax=Senna tora TaxID=362788 RepID=A0A834SJX5_9FABA|nr:putative low molecular weight protein-tyrosine-phosphatase [Senna tora]